MHENVSDVTILTVVISTILLVILGGIIIYFLFAYQRKGYKHQEEITRLQDAFGKTLLQSRIEIQEQTLDHIAKEVHANISHLVSIININLSAYLSQCTEEPHENITEAKTLVKQLIGEIKILSVTLNTDHVGKAGLLLMLEREVDRLKRTGIYQVEFDVKGTVYRLQLEKEIILFRLCQEVLNNIVKHAGATRISVRLKFEASGFLIMISDNGNGFNVQAARSNAHHRKSTGIDNIFNRSTQIDGIVEISSVLHSGTTVSVQIPT